MYLIEHSSTPLMLCVILIFVVLHGNTQTVLWIQVKVFLDSDGEGLFTRNEIYPVSDIRTDIILY